MSRIKEHLQSQSLEIARRSTRAKPEGPSPIHPHMASRTNTSLGAPPRNSNPPDASSPLATDPSKQHGDKTLPVPRMAFGMKSDPLRGRFDPGFAEVIMNEAATSPDDFAKRLHATLPKAVSEN